MQNTFFSEIHAHIFITNVTQPYRWANRGFKTESAGIRHYGVFLLSSAGEVAEADWQWE